MTEPEQRVTALELFFDLVFVFAFTQVTGLMSADPTWGGLGRGLLALAALWWAWTLYAWLTNALEHLDGPLDVVAAVALCGGLGLYFIAHVGFRLRLSHQMGLGRPVTAAVLLVLTPFVLAVPALVALALGAAICCGLIVFAVVHYREARARLRQER